MDGKNNRPAGKTFRALTLLTISASLMLGGCEFFGTQLDENALRAPGELGDGTSIVGSWSQSFSSTSASGEPQYAFTETFTFSPNGDAQIVSHNMNGPRTACTAFGQYRVPSPQNVVIYVQAASPSNCLFPAQLLLKDVKVQVSESVSMLTFTDETGTFSYFGDRAQLLAPVGVWDFDGALALGGELPLDYVFLDEHGFFRIQATLDGSTGFFTGYYVIENGGITFHFFDPRSLPNVVASVEFVQFITDGQNLIFVERDENGGEVQHSGRRL